MINDRGLATEQGPFENGLIRKTMLRFVLRIGQTARSAGLTFLAWRRRRHTRLILSQLDDHALRDIGLTRSQNVLFVHPI